MHVSEQGERKRLPQRLDRQLLQSVQALTSSESLSHSLSLTLSLFPTELQIRQQKGLICASAAILAVDDPRPNIGSGSATLNALISVTECLAAREGHKVSQPGLLCCAVYYVQQYNVVVGV